MLTKPLRLDVHEQIECAQTLASHFYTDPAILQIEKTRIFQRTWQLVGTLSQSCGEVNGMKRTIADPESFFTADVAGEPIIVVRDNRGELRAFSNVCRHRAGPIALGSGCKNVLRCQYHGWTYSLDGRLIGTPDVEGVEFFDRSAMGMVPLRCETWEQFIFVNFDLKAEPLSTYLGQIPQQTKGLQFEGLQFAERRDYLINCNWKVYVDNYLEGYHLALVHPALARALDTKRYRTHLGRWHSLQESPLQPGPAEAGVGAQHALYYFIYPNTMLNILPGRMQTNRVVPLGTRRCRVDFDYFFRADVSLESRAADRAFADQVQTEDGAICERVQRGLASGSYAPGRLNPNQESGVWHFQELLRAAYRAAGATERAAAGKC